MYLYLYILYVNMYIHIIGIDQNVRYMIRNYKNVLILFILSFHIIPDGGFGFFVGFSVIIQVRY